MQVEKFCEFSTVHITKSDGDLLLSKNILGHVGDLHSGAGHWVSVPEWDSDLLRHQIRNWAEVGVSPALINLLLRASTQCCQYMLLDSAADIDLELPRYDW